MNSEVKLKIKIVLILGILFALSPLISTNLSFITGNSGSSEYSDNFNMDNNNLKALKVSGPIYIDATDPNYNWSVAKDAGICIGNGMYSDPYVIEDLVIDGGGILPSLGSCIVINNSDVYFIIRNCKLYNSGAGSWDAGIGVHGTFNGVIINNNCSSNYNYGIYLRYSNDITISGNTANDNDKGIYLISSDNNIISGNTANSNSDEGINLFDSSNNNSVSGNTANNNYYGISCTWSTYNTISGNTANDNYRGISLTGCDYNTISGNTANSNSIGIFFLDSDNNYISGNTLLGNDKCIQEKSGCEGNVFENNDCGIPLVLIIIISSISGGAVIGVATILLIRRKRKRIT